MTKAWKITIWTETGDDVSKENIEDIVEQAAFSYFSYVIEEQLYG